MNGSIVANDVTIRRASPEDVVLCGRICHEAFTAINEQHRFPPDIPSAEIGIGLLGVLFAHPGFYCVVAEIDGEAPGNPIVVADCDTGAAESTPLVMPKAFRLSPIH